MRNSQIKNIGREFGTNEAIGTNKNIKLAK